MNVSRLLAPDFTIGKIIVMRKAIADSLALMARQPTRKSLRFAQLMFRVKPRFTMSTNKSLKNLFDRIQEINQFSLPGDIVECGVWNGGSAAVMATAYHETSTTAPPRVFWLFDSFQGLPEPGEKDGQTERDTYFVGWNKGSVEHVKRIFGKLGLPMENVRIVPGWFDVTLKSMPIERIALLNIDADWYDSVKLVLDALYDKVVPGGYVALDDYGWWHGCDRAVADFFEERKITNITIQRLDQPGGAFFQKPPSSE